MKGFGIYVKNDLLEAKHVKNMGVSIWLYLWLLDKVTAIDTDEVGKVLGGKPIVYEDVAEDLGVTRATYRRWVKMLDDGGYIQTIRTPRGLTFKVQKAVKVFNNRAKNYKYDPDELSRKMSDERKGEKHYNWKGGISSENSRIRMSYEYRKWRKAVFERDGYTCTNCGMKGGNLEADHIKGFAEYPALRFDVGNGQTLCVSCHRAITKERKQQTSDGSNMDSDGSKMNSDGSKTIHPYNRQYKDNTKTIGKIIEEKDHRGVYSPAKEAIRTWIKNKAV